MRLVTCENGHFYDADKYDACPKCMEFSKGGGKKKPPQKMKQDEKGDKNPGWISKVKIPFGKGKDKEQEWEIIDTDEGKGIDILDSVEQGADGRVFNFEPPVMDDDTPTEAMYEKLSDEIKIESSNQNEAEPQKESTPVSNDVIVEDSPVIKEDYDEPYSVNPSVETLQDAVQQISASDDGKTMSFFSATVDRKNVIAKDIEPVVGWVVCIQGENFGESFTIVAGKNSIGRNSSNNIVISKDSAVSREKHAIIIYEHKKREFYVAPGEGSGLTYVNDEFITSPVKVNEREIIEVGSSKLLLVPLCNDKFSWEDYMNINE